MSILSRFRSKFPSVLEAPSREIVEETGEVISSLDEHGYEQLEGTPIAPPVGYSKQPSMHDIIRAAVQSERLRAEAEANGFESFEDADDFDVDDDFDPTTPWEKEFDPKLRELTMRAVDEERMSKGLMPRYFDDYEAPQEAGEGAPPLPVEPKASKPEPKAPSKAPKKGATTSDDED